MDIGLLQGAIGSLKIAGEIAIAIGKERTMLNVQAKAVELHQIIISAQASAFAAQSEQSSLSKKVRELEEEIARVKAWDKQKQRYTLISPWQGAVTYALKKECANSEPAHWICTNCYEDGRKSILNDLQKTPKIGRPHVGLDCHVCGTHTPSDSSRGQIQRKYAEEMGDL